MKRLTLLSSLLLIAAGGCGDDGGTPTDGGGIDSGPGADSGPGTDGGGTDGGMSASMCMAPMMTTCPSDMVPDPGGLMGICCYRQSNASMLAAPEFRLAAVALTGPSSLGSALIGAALQASIDQEEFNWLFRIEGAEGDGPIMLTTGFGRRMAGGTFSFASGDAPMPGDPTRWDPLEVQATLTGESVTAPALEGAFTVPILDETGTMVVLELPLNNLSLERMIMSEDRSCVGNRRATSYCSSDGQLTTYITVEDSLAGCVTIDPIDTKLCSLIAGMPNTSPGVSCMTDDFCTATPQAMWPVPPDSNCTAAGVCTFGGCTPADCNAWRVQGGFAAHGVAIN